MKSLLLFSLLATAAIAQDSPEKIGSQQYFICAACHGPNGEGAVTAPPLAGSEWVNGPVENLIRIQLRGLHGPITVKGVEHDIGTGMPPLAYQSDEQIAAVLSHIRRSFGNQAAPVSPAEVAALRAEVGKPQLVQSDLIPPPAVKKPAVRSTKYDHLESPSPFPATAIAAASVVLGILVFVFLKWKNRNA